MSEDTEWNDILRAKGILPPKVEEQLTELVEAAVHERVHGKALEDRELDELDELEDIEDDRVLESYRRQRIADLKAQVAGERFGRVVQISKTDYTVEVTEASKSASVVLHLFQDYNPACKLLNAILDRLADKHKATKFLKIVADLCIPNYPDRNLPTVLIYKDGEIVKQLIGLDMLGGANATVTTVEGALTAIGAISAKPSHATSSRNDDDDEDEDGNRRTTIRTGFSRISKSKTANDDDDEWD